MGNFHEAERNYLQARFMIPHKVYPMYLLVNLYKTNNKTDKTIETANEILEMDIKIETTAAIQIRKEMEELIKKNEKSPVLQGIKININQ
jgi:O-antigen polymerase